MKNIEGSISKSYNQNKIINKSPQNKIIDPLPQSVAPTLDAPRIQDPLPKYIPIVNNEQVNTNGQISILRLPRVLARLGQSKSTFYQAIKDGLWTGQISLGPRSVGWPSTEVDSLIHARIAGKSDDEIRSLVIRLVAIRKTLS